MAYPRGSLCRLHILRNSFRGDNSRIPPEIGPARIPVPRRVGGPQNPQKPPKTPPRADPPWGVPYQRLIKNPRGGTTYAHLDGPPPPFLKAFWPFFHFFPNLQWRETTKTGRKFSKQLCECNFSGICTFPVFSGFLPYRIAEQVAEKVYKKPSISGFWPLFSGGGQNSGFFGDFWGFSEGGPHGAGTGVGPGSEPPRGPAGGGGVSQGRGRRGAGAGEGPPSGAGVLRGPGGGPPAGARVLRGSGGGPPAGAPRAGGSFRLAPRARRPGKMSRPGIS